MKITMTWLLPVYTCDKFSCQLTEACHVLYNVKSDDKCENEWKELFWNTDHLFLGQENLCLYIWQKIEWHISSVVTHDLTVDTHTFLPLPYQILWRKYNYHVVSLYFYMFHICDLIFTQTLYFENFCFDPRFFLNKYPSMKPMRNVYLWQICNIHNHTGPFILTIKQNWGGNSERNVE